MFGNLACRESAVYFKEYSDFLKIFNKYGIGEQELGWKAEILNIDLYSAATCVCKLW